MTIFFRLLDVGVADKAAALRAAIRDPKSAFDVNPCVFAQVPGSPFAYWVGDRVRGLFQSGPVSWLKMSAKQGLSTVDDFRFARLRWERPISHAEPRKWFPFAKGGAHSKIYSDVHLDANWLARGREVHVYNNIPLGAAGAPIRNPEHYFRPGLTWPRRTQSGLGFRVMPAGCIFADKGPAVFIDGDDATVLLALLAVMTSAPFRYLVDLQMAFGSYEVGVIQRTPLPELSRSDAATLAELATRAWSLKHTLDSTCETSNAFLLPSALRVRLGSFDAVATEAEVARTQVEIDEHSFRAYGVFGGDRAEIERWSARSKARSDLSLGVQTVSGLDSCDTLQEADDESDDGDGKGVNERDSLLSWCVGVAFGRFDLRLAAGERDVPQEPTPFERLRDRSPGMMPEESSARGILIDDQGHSDDLVASISSVSDCISIPSPQGIRNWCSHELFSLHIKMYSKSRRKAPVYWQLATPSASYSVWLYIHAFTNDTLFRVQNDYIGGNDGKLAHEERRLESMARELRDKSTAADRKALAAQEAFVDELRAFLDEVKRVAPLWKPNLDDGVIINFAPLWRLVPQHKAWQKELKATWDALCEGKYDWAHLAMHLWPERVVPKCATDRSFAIAHGLEDVFWIEGSDGKWSARKAPTRPVEELVEERTSPAVKAALKSLLEAPVAAGGAKKARKGKKHA